MTDPTSPRSADIDEATLTTWLREWVRTHGGTDMQDTGGRLVLVCRCGKPLGPSYGPAETGGRDAEERETVAYFQHQAADVIAAFATRLPPATPDVCDCHNSGDPHPRHLPCDMGCQPDWHNDGCAVYVRLSPGSGGQS